MTPTQQRLHIFLSWTTCLAKTLLAIACFLTLGAYFSPTILPHFNKILAPFQPS